MEILESIYQYLAYIFFILLGVWIIYDIVNLIVKKLTYLCVDAETCYPVRANIQESSGATMYHVKVKYMYNNQVCFYTTKWETNTFVPKEGQKRKIYINKSDSSKIYYIEPKVFIFFMVFRLAFFLPLISFLLDK